MALLGFGIIASGPLSWGTGADYARHLPRAVAGWTALGGFLPSVVLGVLAGTAVDMTDSQTSLEQIVPGWFYPLFLLAIVIGSVANNIPPPTAPVSPSRRADQSVERGPARRRPHRRRHRVRAVHHRLPRRPEQDPRTHRRRPRPPGLAIAVADLVLRRNHYPGPGLHDETPTAPTGTTTASTPRT